MGSIALMGWRRAEITARDEITARAGEELKLLLVT
jgi:hypothetical protein